MMRETEEVLDKVRATPMPCVNSSKPKSATVPASGHAGGVAISGLEMSQNSLHYSWTREEVEQRLQEIMHSIYAAASSTAAEYGQSANLVMGANIAGFVKIADAMIAQGVV